MSTIALSDSRWQITFPHRVTPLYEEWFAGLLLRCDEVNHWASGTTLTQLQQVSSPRKPISLPQLSVPTHRQVEYVAEWLALPVQEIRYTTYLPELAHCYSIPQPLPGDLRPSLTFRICPDCLAENHFLKRTLALLYVLYCPWHEVTLLSTCQCGTPLRLFDLQAVPFTCRVCGRDWADLPRISPTAERIAITRQLLSCYELFLSWGDPLLVKKAHHAVFQAWKEEIIGSRKLPVKKRSSRKSAYPHLASNHVASLGSLVFNLVKYHLYSDPKVIFWGQEEDKVQENN